MLAQLHGVAADAGGGSTGHLGVVDGPGVGLAAGAHDVLPGAAGHDDLAIVAGPADGVVLQVNHRGLQGVQRQLSHLVPVELLTGDGGHAVEQTNLVGGGGHRSAPVAGALGQVLVAQSAQHHGRGLNGGQGLAAAEGGGAGAGHESVLIAGGHVLVGPGHNVGEGVGADIVVGGLDAQHQLGHDDGHLVAVDGFVGLKVALAADHNFDGVQDVNGLDVIVVVNVGVAHGTGANDHHTEQHDGSQSQAESPLQVSHRVFPPSKFFGLRGAGFGVSRELFYVLGKSSGFNISATKFSVSTKILEVFQLFRLAAPVPLPLPPLGSSGGMVQPQRGQKVSQPLRVF